MYVGIVKVRTQHIVPGLHKKLRILNVNYLMNSINKKGVVFIYKAGVRYCFYLEKVVRVWFKLSISSCFSFK